MKIGLIMPDFNNSIDISFCDYLIGVDKGALKALDYNLKLDLAIGDFDSVSNDDFNKIKEVYKVIKLNKEKDLTDTKESLNYAYKLTNDVYMFGGIDGKRVEHLIANLTLFNEYPNLKIMSNNSIIYLKNNSFNINYNYKYISFFAYDSDIVISLKGFKYNLNNYLLKRFDSLCISNEVITNDNLVSINGNLLVILSNNDNI